MRALAEIERLLETSMGLHAPSIGSFAVSRAVQQRMIACAAPDMAAYVARLRTSAGERQALVDEVVVNETWFFRHHESFAALRTLALDMTSHGAADRTFRILSLPCSTGEEAYSIAIALLDAGIAPERFRVDAVDISVRALALAARGVYGRNSFRGAAPAFRERHFERAGDAHRVSERVRAQVRFRQGNLLGGDIAAADAYDAIFCRNLLIYFDRATQDQAIATMTRMLSPAGALFVAPSETSLLSANGMTALELPRSFGFRRQAAPKRAVRAAPIAAAPQRPLPALPAPALPAPAPVAALPAAPDLEDATRLADRGYLAEAAAICARHLQQHGPSAPAFYLLALAREAEGLLSSAHDYYRKALYLDANHRETQIHLALLLERLGQGAAAAVLRDRARRLDTNGARAGE